MCQIPKYALLGILCRTVWPGDLWHTSRIRVLQAYSRRPRPTPETQRTFCFAEAIDADLAEPVTTAKAAAATRAASASAASRPNRWRSLGRPLRAGGVAVMIPPMSCGSVYRATIGSN